jgi:hypothetical protein
MRPVSIVCLGVLLVCGLACLAPLTAADEKENDEYVTFTKDHPTGEVLPDKALVYVVRPTSMGFAIKSFFFCDDAIEGINRGSSYFFFHAAPGRRLFWSKSENVDALEQEVEGGKTYYLQQHVRIGGFRARTKLEVLDAAAGEKALAECAKHGTLTEAGRKKGGELVRDYKAETKEDLDRRAKEKP